MKKPTNPAARPLRPVTADDLGRTTGGDGTRDAASGQSSGKRTHGYVQF